MNVRKVLASFLLFSVLILCFIWPIPNYQIHFHRNILIYNNIIISLVLFFSDLLSKSSLELRKSKFALIIILLLTIFIPLNGFFVTPDIKEMITTWNGQWLRPVLLLGTGVIILPIIKHFFPFISSSLFLTLIIIFLWGVVFIHILDTAWLYWHEGVMHLGATRIVYNRTRMSFQINMITGFLLAELLLRSVLRHRFLCLNTLCLLKMLLCNLICTILVNTRWGTVGLVGIFFSTFILIVFYGVRHSRIIVTSSILFIILVNASLLSYISWSTDTRWHSLRQDSIIGWNAPINSFCYIKPNGIILTNRLGYPINHSNGCRASFFHQGWKLIVKHPMGIGPHKEAFRYILRHDTNNNFINVTHSHYGLIEFGIQNGIVGIIGWLILIMGFWYTGWYEFRYGSTATGLFLLVLNIGFFSRTMVDYNLKDHYFEQYMFLTGLLISMCALHIKRFSNQT